MSQPVKLSDALVLEARIAAEAQERSIAGQVEYWAKLGRSISGLLEERAQLRLLDRSKRKSLSELVKTVEGPKGKARLQAYLDSRPFPHFEAHPTRKGLLIRTGMDGTRIVGRFKNRQFVEISASEESLEGDAENAGRAKLDRERALAGKPVKRLVALGSLQKGEGKSERATERRPKNRTAFATGTR